MRDPCYNSSKWAASAQVIWRAVAGAVFWCLIHKYGGLEDHRQKEEGEADSAGLAD